MDRPILIYSKIVKKTTTHISLMNLKVIMQHKGNQNKEKTFNYSNHVNSKKYKGTYINGKY